MSRRVRSLWGHRKRVGGRLARPVGFEEVALRATAALCGRGEP